MADDDTMLYDEANDETKADMIFTDDDEPSPNPSPIDEESGARQSHQALHDVDNQPPSHSNSDDDFQKIEREPEPSMYRAQTQLPYNQRSSNLRNQPQPNNNINSAKMQQLMLRFKELEQEIKRKDEENQQLQHATETLKLEHERDLLELQMEVDRYENESQQYQLRYNEIHDELNELRQSQMEAASSGKEAQDLAIRFNQLEQDHTALMIDFEQSNRTNSTLKQQLKNSQQNLSKLQNTMLKLKKDNTQLEKNLQTSMDKYDILQQQSKSEIHGLAERLDQLQQENEIYRAQLSQAEEDAQNMQNEFTEATMELLTDELNESHGDHKKESTALKLARIDTGDFNRTYNDDTPEPSTPEFRGVTDRFASQTSLPDQSLLDTLAEDDEYGGIGHHSRNSSMGSQMGYGLDATRLKQDIREILHSDIKTLISQELMTASTKSHARLPSATMNDGANGGSIASEDVEQLLMKVDELLAMSKRKSVDLSKDEQSGKKTEAKLDEETLNNMMTEFKESMNDILQKGVIENIISSKDDRMAFQEKMNEKIEDLATKMGDGGDERLNQIMKEAMQKQMTTMQIALENQIGNTVSDTVEDAIDKKINEALRNNIKQDMNVEMEQIKELIMNGMENMEQKDDGTSKLDGNQIEEILNNKLDNIMNGKIDGFMDSFRKEVVPEVQAVFEQLSLVKRSGSYEEADDEKQSNSNNSELRIANNKLKQEIEFLREEKKGFDAKLQEAATSKVHQVVKLQNLLDHMREDNRVLAFQLNKYKEKFVEIRETQEQTPYNMAKNWWYSRNSNYIST